MVGKVGKLHVAAVIQGQEFVYEEAVIAHLVQGDGVALQKTTAKEGYIRGNPRVIRIIAAYRDFVKKVEQNLLADRDYLYFIDLEADLKGGAFDVGSVRGADVEAALWNNEHSRTVNHPRDTLYIKDYLVPHYQMHLGEIMVVYIVYQGVFIKSVLQKGRKFARRGFDRKLIKHNAFPNTTFLF